VKQYVGRKGKNWASEKSEAENEIEAEEIQKTRSEAQKTHG
jgi:hypothetical protein